MVTMSPKNLTISEAADVQSTLIKARQGAATLSQLARAHDLASRAELNGCLGELREHLRSAIPSPTRKAEVVRDIALGVVAGLITEHLLRQGFLPKKTKVTS